MKIVYFLLLNSAVVSAWWATFHEETPLYDRYNMKDTCVATYETLMKESQLPFLCKSTILQWANRQHVREVARKRHTARRTRTSS